MNVNIYETVYTIEIETSTSDSAKIIEVSSDYFGSVVFASDIAGLDDYIANFIDNYEIDCGSP